MTVPGVRLLHQGQLEGARSKLPVQLGRAPEEEANPETENFYQTLLEVLREPAFHDGSWQALQPGPAWEGDPGHARLLAWLWTLGRVGPASRWLMVVNLSADPAQALVRLDFPDLARAACELTDQVNGAVYERDGDELRGCGLYVSLPGHGVHLFNVRSASEAQGAEGRSL